MFEILQSELIDNPELKIRITKRLQNNFPEKPLMDVDETDGPSE